MSQDKFEAKAMKIFKSGERKLTPEDIAESIVLNHVEALNLDKLRKAISRALRESASVKWPSEKETAEASWTYHANKNTWNHDETWVAAIAWLRAYVQGSETTTGESKE